MTAARGSFITSSQILSLGSGRELGGMGEGVLGVLESCGCGYGGGGWRRGFWRCGGWSLVMGG
jgi:hypothetical protein